MKGLSSLESLDSSLGVNNRFVVDTKRCANDCVGDDKDILRCCDGKDIDCNGAGGANAATGEHSNSP